MQSNFSRGLIGFGLGLLLFAGCSKKSSKSPDTSSSSIQLTGILAIEGESTSLRLTETAITDLSVYCVTFSLPPVAGTGAVSAEGKFSVTLNAAGASVGCFILDSAKSILGTMVFEDSAKKDLNGEPKSADRFALEGGASDLGAITFNLSTGKAKVDVAKIVGKVKDTTVALTDAYDFSGNYVFEASGQKAPEGYANLCTAAEQEASHNNNNNSAQGKRCDGPSLNMPIYFKRLNGVVPGTTKPIFGMALWASKSLDNLCGNKLGISYADGISHGIDLSNSGVGEGDFTWDPNLADGWKSPAARAKNSLLKQESVDNFKGFPGTKQFFHQYHTFTCNPGSPCSEGAATSAAGFQFNANTKETGCRNVATGKSVQVNDWSGMQCETTQLNGGLNKNTCKKTYEGAEVACVNIGGTFLANETPIANAVTRFPGDYVVLAQGSYCDYNNNNAFDGNESPLWNNDEQSCNAGTPITEGQLCSSINASAEGGQLAQLRCYAEGRKGGDGDFDSCQREVRTNWNAKTAAEFVQGKSKPKGQFAFELFDYDSATSGSLRGEERDYRGIQVGDNFTDCEIVNVFSLSIKKIDGSNDLYGEMIQNETNVSPKPACIANFPASAPTKYMFKLVKQAD
ncbi:MAG: hypothetical protein EOP07_16990 [Proteobacteria bacterium]|nr:MAG: hypothetical protein EOP07_16990 [Pseudomonadota bacterium]